MAGGQLEHGWKDGLGQSVFEWGKQSWITGCGALQELPFQLEGALETHIAGLWEFLDGIH